VIEDARRLEGLPLEGLPIEDEAHLSVAAHGTRASQAALQPVAS
jgi:hypothetical protein